MHCSIGHSPFVANYGSDPRTHLNLINPPIDLIPLLWINRKIRGIGMGTSEVLTMTITYEA